MQQDLGIREFGSCRLAVRGDLLWIPQMSGGQRYYLVEDPLNAKFYRIGTAEYAFVSLLDGTTSVGEALNLTATALPNAAFTEHEALTICNWLLENGLVRTSERVVSPEDSTTTGNPSGPDLHRFNPLVTRLPLLHPDRFFDITSRWVSWWFSPWAFIAWLALGIIAVFQLTGDWNSALTSFAGVFSPLNWIWLPLCWFGLKLVHEFAHGAACKTFGGTVREAGIILILFLPVTYVDVSSSWRFRSKWHRITTAAAGMYTELLVASIATLLWAHTSPGLFHSLCFNVIVMASLTTLVFNANFLMRFDGYYMLSDWLELPNLAAISQQQLTRTILTPVFCAGPEPPGLPPTRAKRLLVTCYGLASFLWKIVVCTCMAIAATALFEGAGKILAVLAALMWLGMPAVRLFKRIARMRLEDNSTRGLSLSAVGLAMGVAALLVLEVPWPLFPQAPVVVDYAPLTILRADSPGFVEGIHVQGGQLVQEGQLLAVLRNENLALELADLERAIEQLETKCRVFEHGRDFAARQAEVKQLEALQKKLKEKEEQMFHLTVRAPSSGRILGSNLQNLVGVYLQPGDEILMIGSEHRKELKMAIAQEKLPAFKTNVGRPVRVRFPGGQVYLSELLRIEPRASLDCPHVALSGANGGPLEVKAKTQHADEPRENEEQTELLVPHFIGCLSLTGKRSTQLRAGQVGCAVLTSHREAVGSYLFHALARWTRQQFRRAAAQGQG